MAPKTSPGRKTPVATLKLDVSRLEERDVPAAFSGTVFLDTNVNGNFDATPAVVNNVGAGQSSLGTEVGYSGLNQPWDPVATRVPILVRAFDGANVVQGSATTDLNGTYTLSVAAAGAYRLEFSNLPVGVSFGPSGQQVGTAVQTASVTAAGTTPNVNLGLVRFEDITPDNPTLVTNEYFFGAFDSGNADKPAVTSVPYNSGSSIPAPNGDDPGPYTNPVTHTIQIKHSAVGATWGLAYDRVTDRIFMSAFTKSHAGYGPGGPGAIYAAGATPTPGTTTVTAATQLVNLGVGAAGVNYRDAAAFTDPANTAGQNPYIRDGLYKQTVNGVTTQVGWDAVGKTGLGGLDTDATGRFLFTVGLNDRNLYVVDTQNPTAAPLVLALPVVTGANGYTGTSTANPLGDLRPFSVSYYRGSIYVGAVNTAESTTLGGTVVGDRNALRAYVFQYKLNLNAAGNPTGTGQFVDLNGAATSSQAVLVAPLNYGRGYIVNGDQTGDTTANAIPANWLPWTPVYRNITNANIPQNAFYPQPWLTGLTFGTNGDITLGIRDRSGDQFGPFNPADTANPNQPYAGIPGGDTLRAFANEQVVGGSVTSRWSLESNGSGPSGPASANGVGNLQGPGGGEFYAGDFLVPRAPGKVQDHQEVSLGGVLQLPGYPDVAVTSFDPAQIPGRYNAGGVRWYRNAQEATNRAGESVRAYELYINASGIPETFGKANGIGDLVAIRQATQEIGNKIFADLNSNGRQDPAEPGIAGVAVTLFRNGVSVGATTTDAAGNYYFTSAADPGVANRVPGKAYGVAVLPNTAYQVRVPLAQSPLTGLTVTTTKISGGTEPQRDSDATVVGPNAVIDLTTGQSGANDHTFDAGFILRLSLGDFVWNDANNNGFFDAGEAPIANVTVQLLDAANNVTASTTTNAQGGYLFTDLLPGQYRVRIPLAPGVNAGLTGFVSSSGTNGSPVGPFEPANATPTQRANNTDNGVTQVGGVVGSLVNVQAGLAPLDEPTAANFDPTLLDTAENANSFRSQDFGFYRPLSIGDTVFVDRNNDGLRSDESGLAGVTVQLLQVTPGSGGTPSTATVATTATNVNGGYLFTNLAGGDYRVRLVRDAALNGYISSTGAPGRATGPSEPAVGNPVNDRDHGTQSANFIDGPTLTYAPGGAVAVNPATIPAGLPADSALPDSQFRDQDFGVFQPLELGDLVFEDTNNSGVRDVGEPGIPNVLVELLDATGTPVRDPSTNLALTASTTADGLYLFSNLTPGSYRLRITPPAGYRGSTGVNGSDAGPFEPGLPGTDPTNDADHGTRDAVGMMISSSPVILYTPTDARNPSANRAGLANSANLAQDFGLYRNVSLGDFVWEDFNNNGLFDAGEVPIAGVTVRLLDGNNAPVIGSNGQPIATQTAADGGYLFANLVSGTYRVEVVIPAGYLSSTGSNGSLTGPFEPVANPANPDNNRDHGTTQPGGTTVRGPLVNAQPGLAPLNDLAGPASATAADVGTLNGSSYRDQDFGFFRPLAVGDLVWLDANNDGLHQASEAGVPNVRVSLLDAAGATVASTVTGTNGDYRFSNLVAGVYSVKITPPAGLTSSTGGTGSAYEPAAQNNVNDADKGTGQADGSISTLPFTLLPSGNPNENGTANLTQDFGLITPPPPASLSVGDFVWFDANNNGVLDAGEVGAANVTVRLIDAAGATVATQVTNANGGYLFTGLAAGVYSVEIAPPAGFRSSTGGTGSPFEPAPQNNTNNADKGTLRAGGAIRTEPFSLTATGNPDANGTANLRQDFGLFAPPVVPPPPGVPPANISGTVYLDANVNGVRDPGERPIPATRVYLNGRDDAGNPVALTAVTDTLGNYRFDNLAPGTYTVREQQPDGKLYNGSTNVGTVAGTVTGTGGNDIISTVRLNPGDSGVNYNFGEIPTAGTFGYVWFDANRNGVYDSTESPIAGVTVTLAGTAFPGTPFARPLTAADAPGGLTAVTNNAGRYDFPTLPFGTYTLAETQPIDYDDWQLQDGDPSAPRPTMTTTLFSNVSLTAAAPFRGPFNFGEVLSATTVVPPLSPEVSKRDFLASTTTRGRTSPVTSSSTTSQEVPATAGVVAPVSLLPLQPNLTSGANPANAAILATGAGPGTSPLVRVFDYSTGLEKFRFLAYEEAYTGGVRTAVGDINGDGVPDVIVATGLGGGPRVRVFSGVDCSVLQDFFAYESTYTGGLSVAAGDVNGDGQADIITGTDMGGGPRVRVFDGKTGAVAQDFFAFDSTQRGGVRVASADVNKDGRADVIAATGAGVPTRVRVFNGATQSILQDFLPFGDGFSGGAFVAAGDTNGDGQQDIVVGADAGGGPRVSVFDGLSGVSLSSFFAYETSFSGGVRVGALDVSGTGRSAIVTAAGVGGGSRVTVYSGPGVGVVDDFYAYDATQNGGVYVGAGSATRKAPPSSGTPVVSGQFGKPGTLPVLPA